MALSVRLFGLSSWSILVPEALLGVASVGVLYATVRRSLLAFRNAPGSTHPLTARNAHWAALIGAADGHGEHVRFSWGLGPDGAEAPIKGTDYVLVQDGRLKRVTGFLDQVPG